MLERTAVAQVRRVAELAKAARDARDQMLVHVGESKLGEPKVARGLHDPAAAFGFDPLPPDHPTRLALRDAIAALPPDARDELRALEGGPFPSEEATWAEIALGESKEASGHGARDAGSDRSLRSRRAKLAVDNC